jgi:hypothetical protein
MDFFFLNKSKSLTTQKTIRNKLADTAPSTYCIYILKLYLRVTCSYGASTNRFYVAFLPFISSIYVQLRVSVKEILCYCSAAASRPYKISLISIFVEIDQACRIDISKMEYLNTLRIERIPSFSCQNTLNRNAC